MAARPSHLAACLGVASALVATRDAHAFKPEGHVVIEVMAYRELGTGPDGDVLGSLIRDGALEAPVCFWNRSRDCMDRFESDPLAWWPAPHADAADMVLARQFSHSGQCFHFMAEQDDENGPHWVDPANPRDPHVSYGLMWDAYLRCVNQLEWMLWRVVENPIAARKQAHGLYELMHAVMDSYSRAHTERDYDAWKGDVDPTIEFLKIWQPTVGNPFSEESRNTRHEIFEVRDEHYIEPDPPVRLGLGGDPERTARARGVRAVVTAIRGLRPTGRLRNAPGSPYPNRAASPGRCR